MKKIKEWLKALFKFKDLFALLVERDIKLKYRRSFLGYLWSVLSPLGVMAVMALVFSKMFGRTIEYFPVYLLSGNMLFSFFREAATQSIYSVTGNAALLKKAYVPKYIFTVSKVTSNIVNLCFSLAALFIVMLITGVPFTWKIVLMVIPLALLYIFSIGMGLFLAQLNVFFRDIQYIWNVVMTAWMYLTPIFYSIDILPDWLQWAIPRFNPMYFYITVFRDVVVYGTFPWWNNVLYGAICAVLMLALGCWSFIRKKDKFILYI